MGNDVPAAARLVVLTDVDVSIQDDGEAEPTLPTSTSASPAPYEQPLPKRRMRSISAGSRIGNIW
jgi:hypothetical protein